MFRKNHFTNDHFHAEYTQTDIYEIWYAKMHCLYWQRNNLPALA